MGIIVVGGQARDIGKTTVAASIIAALPEWNWTAIKITGFGPKEAATYGDGFRIEREQRADQSTDSSRFLKAGARRAFWLRVPVGELAEAMAAFHGAAAGAEYLIVESNSILEFVQPDVYLLLVDPARGEFKQAARRFLDRADAYVEVPGFKLQVPVCGKVGTSNLDHATRTSMAGGRPNLPAKPVFRLGGDRRVTGELIDFIRASLQGGK